VVLNANTFAQVPLLNADTMKAGRYQLLFYVAEYFAKRGVALPDPPFVDRAVIQFGITDAAAHYRPVARLALELHDLPGVLTGNFPCTVRCAGRG
jgi:5-hydroxyisourate hydrolase-like protein (transthyretin family)